MGEKQMIISVGREFGSGGHVIAEKLAKEFGLPLYDHNLLREIAGEKDFDAQLLKKYDEVPKNRLISRTVNGYSNSPSENIAKMQFDFLKGKAEAGESFVVVGRCSEKVLKGYPGLITIFILGDMEAKIQRIMEVDDLSRDEAKELIRKKDKKRKTYHNYYSEGKWGDSRNYDLSINSSRLGIDETVEAVIDYIKRRQR